MFNGLEAHDDGVYAYFRGVTPEGRMGASSKVYICETARELPDLDPEEIEESIIQRGGIGPADTQALLDACFYEEYDNYTSEYEEEMARMWGPNWKNR